MMLPSLAFMLLSPQGNPFVAPPLPAGAVAARLVAASMFKNGFAVTQRVIDVAKPGATVVMPIPSGAMGTLWFTPSEGMELDSVVVENDPATSTATIPAQSIDALLDLNVGSVVTLVLAEKEGPPSRLTGKLLSSTGTVAVVEGPETTKAVPKATIASVEGKGLKFNSTTQFSTGVRVMRVRTSGKAGQVGVVALERGLSWSPSYAVNLQPDGKTLTLVAKATVVNDLETLKAIDCKFVTGFPNLPFANTLDPLVEMFIRQDGFGGGMGGGAGGFGGQAPGAFSNQEARRGANVGMKAADSSLIEAAGDGEALGELFFYPHKGVSVGVQGRAAYTLFAMTAPYETVYAWDLDDPSPGLPQFVARIPPPGAPSTDEIWQTLRFANAAKLPLTTAPATTFEAGEILGQDTLRYVSPAQTAELRVTRTLDVSTDFTEEEIGRERGFVKGRNKDGEYPIYDRVTAKGTLTLVNRKAVPIKMRIRKPYTGTWVSGEGSPKIAATAAGLRLPNPTGTAEWTPTLPAGGTLKLTFTTRLLVGS